MVIMKKIIAVAFAACFAVSVYAQAPAAPAPAPAVAAPAASDCAAKAVSKSGKPLSGAAKTSSIKKCEAGK
jgi:photosystem II stability/assembly factor-like uncharacterized protein